MNKIQKFSRFFRILFQFLFILQPILLIVFWGEVYYWRTDQPGFFDGLSASFIPRSVKILHQITASEALYGFLIGTVPTIAAMLLFFFLIRLFKLYEQSEIFSLSSVRNIRNIGIMTLVSQVIEFIYEPVLGIILTIHNPPGHRLASITVDNYNIHYLITAIVIILVSWVMNEAAKLQEEQKLIV